MRPGEALGALAGSHRHPNAAGGVQRQQAQRLRERARIAAGGEQAIEAVAHDVAVARDVRRHDGRASGERLGEDHPEALAAEGRRAEHVGAPSCAAFSPSETFPNARTSRSSSSSGVTSSGPAPTSVSVAGTCSRSASNARSRTGSPLRSTAWPMNKMRNRAHPVAIRSGRSVRDTRA